jgi:transposase InsO family protein
MSLTKRQMIEREVERLHMKSGIAAPVLAGFAGVSGRTWREWQGRQGQETRHNGHIPRDHWVTPEEAAAILAYCQGRMEAGYRVLCWQMVDANIAAVSPATVYNVLKRGGLTKKWAEQGKESKKGFDQPKGAHEQWHTDFSYIRVCGNYYYFVSVMDGHSRKILSWGLYESMERIWAEAALMKAGELYPEAHPRVITDNGSQFISKDFRELVSLLEMEQTFTSPAHPQSNGKLERFHRTFKSEHVRQAAYLGREDAIERMKKWIHYYNGERLHAALYYLPPDDVFSGRMGIRLAERRQKLHTASINRQSYWRSLAAKL